MINRIEPGAPTMTPQEFIQRWRNVGFGERQAAQTWFNDLLRVVGAPDPIEVSDPERFTFEKRVSGGFADAYLEGSFGWEFKGADAQLPGAFDQLLRYQVYLRTPPLLVVSSFQMIRVQTNFRDKETVVHDIPIAELGDPEQLGKLRDIFFEPGAFEPQRTVDDVTRETALLFGQIAEDMEQRGGGGEQLARYLNQIVFCLYAEDAGLLRSGLFSDIVRNHWKNPDVFNHAVKNLFDQMAGGGLFGADAIAHFNGDLFSESETVELSGVSLFKLMKAIDKNWRDIEPSIFGTLFEGALDATKRSQLGAHYTSPGDIMLVVEPVLMKPLRREWDDARHDAEALLAQSDRDGALMRLKAFQERLASVTVLDPACGSGNFLYIALRSLLDLEKETIDFAERQGFYNELTTGVKPAQMLGIEISPYAAEITRTALWIGYIQWHQTNGFGYTQIPILTSLDGVRRMDAILDYDDEGNAVEPEWPDAEFIVGNPPFLGRGQIRGEFGDGYTNDLFAVYDGRLPHASDFCCYWFEKARALIEQSKAVRAGLLGTQGIRGGHNRVVLQRIKETGDIFMAHSDREWMLEGATVHISIVGFDDGTESDRTLDERTITTSINPNLTTGVDTTLAKHLKENEGISFEGQSPKARFDIPSELAVRMLSEPLNVNGRPNSDVVFPVMNGKDITERNRGMFTINFGLMSLEEACQYEMPFEYAKTHVYPQRQKKSQSTFRNRWWQYARPRPVLREALDGLDRYIATPRVSKHRVFVWVEAVTVCNDATDVFARDDDYTFGILHSKAHEIWARALGTQLREAESGFRYTPTACFETFPFPRPTEEQREAIAAAAGELNRMRYAWLNPVDAEGEPVVFGVDLRQRMLTKLYNEYEKKHTWLVNVHERLDAAVAAAYGWDADLSDTEVLERLLALNLERYEEEREAG